ncbi:hypothetical protein [Sporosarcina sp. ITBMC105]
MKKPIYKRWWFYLVAFIGLTAILGAIGAAMDDGTAAEPEKPVAPQAEAVKTVEERIDALELKRVSVSSITDNNDVVLPYLVYDATGGHKSSVRVITKYSDAIAGELTQDADISELTIFWELPGIMKEGAGNVAKFTYTRVEDKLVHAETWLAPALRE